MRFLNFPPTNLIFTQNDLIGVDSRKDMHSAVKIPTFSSPWPHTPKTGQVSQIFGLRKFWPTKTEDTCTSVIVSFTYESWGNFIPTWSWWPCTRRLINFTVRHRVIHNTCGIVTVCQRFIVSQETSDLVCGSHTYGSWMWIWGGVRLPTLNMINSWGEPRSSSVILHETSPEFNIPLYCRRPNPSKFR